MPTTAQLPVSRRARRTAAALAAAALATSSLAACGSSEDGPSGSGASGGTPAAEASPSELLRAAVPATTAKGSYHLALRATVAEAGRPFTVRIEGDQATSPTRASFEASVPQLGSVNVRYLSGKLYAKVPQMPRWYAIDVAAFARDLGPLGGSLTASQDPLQLVTALERGGDVDDEGTADVGGTSTRHLRGSVTLRDLNEAAGGAASRSFEQLERLTADDPQLRRQLDAPIVIDFYVQRDGAIRRLAASGSLSGERFGLQADLTDFGEDVDVQAPPASQQQELRPADLGRLAMAG